MAFSAILLPMLLHRISFGLLLFFTWPLRFLPYTALHFLGNRLGLFLYFAFPKYRKRALSNLQLAKDLKLSEEETISLAKASLQNLAITCLEYAKFASEKEIHRVVRCENPEQAEQLMQEGKPVIFFCGHQANWEVLFLEGTKRMPGVAIGRPVKNPFLYNWVLSIREKYGGKIIAPKNAIREGLRGLKKGAFLGIVGDQGMPDSGYSSPFLGRRAWTSPMAAILSHRTGSPIIVATTLREKGKYIIHYSDPIWPKSDQPLDQEIDRMMRASLLELENSIKKNPGQWLFSHNRWKQQTPDRLKKRFRHESILIVLPQKAKWFSELSAFREIYPTEFLTFYVPKGSEDLIRVEEAEIIVYEREEDLFQRDYRFKLLFDLVGVPALHTHFKKLAVFEVVTLPEILEADKSFSESLKAMLYKPTHPPSLDNVPKESTSTLNGIDSR